MINEIMMFEEGMLSEVEEIILFSKLVKTGVVNSLQGRYQRQAVDMVNSGIINREGDILIDFKEIY